jgi:hypothetical protein
MAMLVGYAYERAGVVAAVAAHFSTNTTTVLLGVNAPVVQAMIMGIQALIAVILLATVRPANKPAPVLGTSAPDLPVHAERL